VAALAAAALLAWALAPSALGWAAAPALDQAVQRGADSATSAGAIGYLARVDDGGGAVTAASGLADRATGRKLLPEDQFEIGSITKTFMATLTLQLVGQGKLKLTDTVEQYLPRVVPNGDHITVRMLLQHTSGLAEYATDASLRAELTANPTGTWTPEHLVAAAVKAGPKFAPGAGWAYSNTNYTLIGMILAKITGTSPAQLLAERITTPLGLQHTYLPEAAATSTGAGYAHGYLTASTSSGLTYTDISTWTVGSFANTAGGIISTASDVTLFFTALLGGTLLPAAQLSAMRTTVTFPADVGLKGGYGLGLIRLDTPCGTVWGHDGDTLGHHSSAFLAENGGKSAIADASVEPDPRSTAPEGFTAIAHALEVADATGVCAMNGQKLPSGQTFKLHT
jgi:D-alanyl-D-alanine carboxypeptidase